MSTTDLIARLRALANVVSGAIDNLWADPHRDLFVQLTETTAQTIVKSMAEAAAALASAADAPTGGQSYRTGTPRN